MLHTTKPTSHQPVEKVKQLIAPLDKMAGIHYFCYGVNLPDTSGFTLHTNQDFYEAWFKHRFPLCGFHLPNGWYSWDSVHPAKQTEVAHSLNLGNGVIYVRHHADKTEVFSFASRPDNKHAQNFYLNNLNLLKRFTNYFLEKADNLIQEANQQRVMPLPEMVLKQPEPHIEINDPMVNRFLDELSFPLNLLSERETECFKLLIKGFSLADISKTLNLAIPTVAVYVTRVKQKLKCLSKHQLIQKAHELGMVELNVEGLA